ncbi:MAG: RNA polymerase sporulation sigma factor SigH [Lachnospiraceae bacterium]|nr:RNA polymerase sporulation sigma factor SigH [Lachnospiraceae bacterium]
MEKQYDDFTDEELILRLRDGEGAVTDYIMNKYKNLVRSKAKTMYILGGDSDDLIQEGMIGLFKAVRDFDPGRDASFFTFADLCIMRQMYTAIQSYGRKKHSPLNFYTSLYENMANKEKGGEDAGEAPLMDIMASEEENNPESLLIDKENVENIERIIQRELSVFEKQVLDLYITGMNYTEIARVLGKDEKSTDNALQRLKTKLKKYLQSQT